MTPAEIRAIPCPTEHDEGDDFEIMEAKESYIAGWEACADAVASRLEAARHVEAEQGEITEEWLRSIGGVCEPGRRRIRIDHTPGGGLDIKTGPVLQFDGCSIGAVGEPAEWSANVDRNIKIKTRADVLNLLRALGIEGK